MGAGVLPPHCMRSPSASRGSALLYLVPTYLEVSEGAYCQKRATSRSACTLQLHYCYTHQGTPKLFPIFMPLSFKVSNRRFSKPRIKAVSRVGREPPPKVGWRTGSHIIFLSLTLILEALRLPCPGCALSLYCMAGD